MGVDTLVYNAKSWVKGNKYNPREKAVFYVRFPFSKSPFFRCMYTNRKTDILHPSEISELRDKKLDIINLGKKAWPFGLDQLLERAIMEYEVMCSVVDSIEKEAEDPFVIRLDGFIQGVEAYFRKPSELARHRLIYVANLMAQRFPFSDEIYNLIFDIELCNNDIARLRIERYQAILAGDDTSVQELTAKIEQLTSSQVRG